MSTVPRSRLVYSVASGALHAALMSRRNPSLSRVLSATKLKFLLTIGLLVVWWHMYRNWRPSRSVSPGSTARWSSLHVGNLMPAASLCYSCLRIPIWKWLVIRGHLPLLPPSIELLLTRNCE